MEVLQYDEQRRSYYFSEPLSQAIGQCQRYLDILHDEASEGGLLDHPEIVAWHPSAKIVIGRSSGWDESKLKALHSLNQNMVRMDVMTYDHLLAMGERLLGILEGREGEGEGDPPEAAGNDEILGDIDVDEIEDDIPF